MLTSKAGSNDQQLLFRRRTLRMYTLYLVFMKRWAKFWFFSILLMISCFSPTRKLPCWIITIRKDIKIQRKWNNIEASWSLDVMFRLYYSELYSSFSFSSSFHLCRTACVVISGKSLYFPCPPWAMTQLLVAAFISQMSFFDPWSCEWLHLSPCMLLSCHVRRIEKKKNLIWGYIWGYMR